MIDRVTHWWRARRPADPGWVPLRRNGSRLRRWLSAGAAAAATAAALSVLAPDPPAGRLVVVATRDVPAGSALQAADLRLERRPAAAVPAAAARNVSSVVGRIVAAPLDARDLVTDSRLVGRGLLAGRPADDVAAPVRVADGEAAALLRPGDRVDVLVAVEGARSARTVAVGATVLAAPSSAGSAGLLGQAGDGVQGGLVLLAVPDTTAAGLAAAAAAGPLSVVVR